MPPPRATRCQHAGTARQHQHERRAALAFWDEYKEVGGNFIKAAEKQILMDEGVPFNITAVVEDQTNKYGPRYAAQVVIPEGVAGVEAGERTISFPIGTVESRDRMLGQMATYLDREDADDVVVKLEKVGQSILIRQA